MAFAYNVGPSTPATVLATHGTVNTELTNAALRQAVRGFDLYAVLAGGRGAALTAITGIALLFRRWTTVGTGGTASVPAPTRIGTVASTTAVDSFTAITQGTVSGAIVGGFTFGAAGPGGWVAPNPDAMIHVEAGSADEIAINSVSGVTAMSLQIPTISIQE